MQPRPQQAVTVPTKSTGSSLPTTLCKTHACHSPQPHPNLVHQAQPLPLRLAQLSQAAHPPTIMLPTHHHVAQPTIMFSKMSRSRDWGNMSSRQALFAKHAALHPALPAFT